VPRSGWIRSASLVGALALMGALALPTAAQAAPGDDVLVFSNSSVVDTGPGAGGGEYEWISAAIAAAGYNVTSFDGGDGEAATWTTALTGIEVFVLPEQEHGNFYDPDSPPGWLSAAAMSVLVDWIQAGGTVLVSGTCTDDQGGTASLLSEAVGVDYDGALGDCDDSGETSTRWIDDSSLPAELEYANGTYPMALGDFSAAQRAPLKVWYSADDACSEQLTVGEFAAGSGRIAFEAWDYFNDGGADQAAWNEVLASLLNGNSSVSNWEPPAPPPTPTPVSAVTPSGQSLYTISEFGCNQHSSLFRVHPGTAHAAPVGGSSVSGNAGQGAMDPTTGIAYLPFEDDDSEDEVLLTVDPDLGAFAEVGEFSADVDYLYEVYSIAIARDGSAYAFAEVEIDGEDVLGLFSLDLSDASLTLIAEVDDSELDEPNGFAFNPQNGKFYAFEEDSHELFQVNAQTGALVSLGTIAAPSLDEDSDVTALQIGQDGTFWVVFDVPISDDGDWAGMLATFKLGDIAGGEVNVHEVGILTDDPLESYSLLLGPAELAATGVDAGGTAGIALSAGAFLVFGTALVVVRRRRRRNA
jgi:hypothetical protein